jgi:hypothetical protein
MSILLHNRACWAYHNSFTFIKTTRTLFFHIRWSAWSELKFVIFIVPKISKICLWLYKTIRSVFKLMPGKETMWEHWSSVRIWPLQLMLIKNIVETYFFHLEQDCFLWGIRISESTVEIMIMSGIEPCALLWLQSIFWGVLINLFSS